jgi:hypothetical protein
MKLVSVTRRNTVPAVRATAVAEPFPEKVMHALHDFGELLALHISYSNSAEIVYPRRFVPRQLGSTTVSFHSPQPAHWNPEVME